MAVIQNNITKKTSRICVKNLPSRLTLDRFKEHFAQKGEFTDAQIIKSSNGRPRIGFVGYLTEQLAEEAIRYFNKSYIGTSSITCEFALGYGDPDITHSWSRCKKRKLNEKKSLSSGGKAAIDKTVINDPKFQEFLNVVQPRSKSKLWANDLVAPNFNQTELKACVTKQEDRKKSTKEFIVDENARNEDGMLVENQAKSQDMSCDYAVKDVDYFRSRVRKAWSDSESDTDDDGPADVQRNIVSEDQEGLLEGGHCDELTKTGNSLCSPQGASEDLQSARLYVRNIYRAATEDELAEYFSGCGNVKEVHLVIDKETKQSKGFAYVVYSTPEEAAWALKKLKDQDFQGRILHVEPAKPKPASQNIQQQRVEKRKAQEASGDTRAWNSSFMSSDTIVENIARKLGVSKREVLNCEADDLAVRVALGETQIIAETKNFLTNAGVNVASLEESASRKSARGKTSKHVILVKNLPFSASEGELAKMFGEFGSLDRIIFPPTRTLALVIFLEPAEAQEAFECLKYHRISESVLYLEWAPSNILSQDVVPDDDSKRNMVAGNREAEKVLLKQQVEDIAQVKIDPNRDESRTLYVKNLFFGTTEESLGKHIRENMKEGKISSVRILKQVKGRKKVSAGYGFVEFDSVETANNICRDLQGTVLDGYTLSLQLSHPKEDESGLKKMENDRSSTKLVVKNVAFEATKKDLGQLFSTFGQVKSLRLPMTFRKHNGFAFVEYVTKQEAQNACKALSNTHLYGRHLVLERAIEVATLKELRKKIAAQFVKGRNRIQDPRNSSKKRKF